MAAITLKLPYSVAEIWEQKQEFQSKLSTAKLQITFSIGQVFTQKQQKGFTFMEIFFCFATIILIAMFDENIPHEATNLFHSEFHHQNSVPCAIKSRHFLYT